MNVKKSAREHPQAVFQYAYMLPANLTAKINIY